MSRSVVLNHTPRCPHCLLAPRWCICAGLRPCECLLQVDILMHFMEDYRPSSTGHLIKRVIPSAQRFIYRRERPLDRTAMGHPEKEIWILHPDGERLPLKKSMANVQVLLLDGTWAQVAGMARAVGGWGRRVSLPMKGESRYWLRAQGGPDRFSTVEALLFLLTELGLSETHAQLRLQFELHVFANLCARGHKQTAVDYLADSPIAPVFPELIARLLHSRRNFGPPPNLA